MEKSIENYRFFQSDLIGKGFTSSVYKAVNQNDGSSVAIKVIYLKALKESTMKLLLESETVMLRSFCHPNIL